MGGVCLNSKIRTIGISLAAILGTAALLYFGGMLGQLLDNYSSWQQAGGMTGQATMGAIDWNPISCYRYAFSGSGLKGTGILLLIGGANLCLCETA